ncbi:hypothetical protein AGMMS49546_00600 [Spirochaetia bacterium]|nr:hypothetical protein AGMMS49546_00600 [Spirochaetia bacterium]
MRIKKIWIILFFSFLPLLVFPQENDKRFSIQTNPLQYAADIAYLFMDNDTKTFVIATDVEFQYAINKDFSISVANTLFFENYLDSFLENSKARYNEDYGLQFQCMFYPAVLYRPFGTRMKGAYMSAFPIIGLTSVSTKHLNDGFAHLGLGLSAGYQWIFKNGFTLQLGAGMSKTWIIPFMNNKGTYRTQDEWHLLGLLIDLNYTFRIGYSF